MSRRIDIELTSKRSENEWTWRAAGAKQPKGVLDAAVLYPDAKVGDVTRAEADFEIEGITITQVYAPQGKRKEADNRLEIKGSGRDFQPVTSQLVSKGERRGRDGDRRPRRDDERGGRGERGERRPRGDRPERSAARPDRPDRAAAGRPSGRGERTSTGAPRRERPARPPRPEAPSYKRLTPKDVHRKAVLEQLPPESRPIAEQVLRGGIPAVRQAVEAENAKAKAEGRPEINGPALVSMAEDLLPQLKAAEWMDRAEAAKVQASEISVRDLRAVVTSADAVARTDEARLLASELREALERRTNEERDRWIAEITTSLDESRVIRALRLSARPPDPQVKFPPELLDRLKTATEDAMSPETAPDRWVTLLDAVANSPIRRNVEPKGLPAEPGEELLSAAKQAAGRIPALAKQLGVSMPPPPRRVPPKPAAQATAGASGAAGVSEPDEPAPIEAAAAEDSNPIDATAESHAATHDTEAESHGAEHDVPAEG